MFTRSALDRSLLVMVLAVSGCLWADERPGLGVAVGADEVEAVDFVILPDGQGLPPGSGTPSDGLVVYQRECRLCHGDDGHGGPNDRLVGGRGSLASAAPVKTVGSYWPYATTIFDYLRRSMPYHSPGVLSDDQLYALTAYLLRENGIIDDRQVINAETLPAVDMPNRDGFIRAWPEG